MKTRREVFIFLFLPTMLIIAGNAWYKNFKFNTTPFFLIYDSLNLPPPKIPTENPLTYEGVRLGRLLFYDNILSGNNSQSCANCHQQKYCFSDGLPLAIGSQGDTLDKNTMSLSNLAWQDFYFWDGRAAAIEDVIINPITNPNEMNEDTTNLLKELNNHKYYPLIFKKAFNNDKITFKQISFAISQFLRTIVTKGIKLPDSVLAMANEYEKESRYITERLNNDDFRGMYFRLATICGGCHFSPVYSGDMENNLVTARNIKMKTPTLINVTLTAPYMHDGRFKNLEEVFEHYDKHMDKLNLKMKKGLPGNKPPKIRDFDKKYFKKFLEYFTDSSVITNPHLSNPFEDEYFSWEKEINNL